MDSSQVERKLAAIVSADIAGYSRLMGKDEPGTLAAMKGHLAAIEPVVSSHNGRIFKMLGDGFLAEFSSVLDAVDCAVAVQRLMRVRNSETLPERRLEFRIGVNLGDVILDGGDVFGDGVNLAARLQTIAEPGSICVSRTVRDQVRDKLPYAFEELGAHEVKNLPRPIYVYAVRFDREASRGARRRLHAGRMRQVALALGVIAALILGAAIVSRFDLRRDETPPTATDAPSPEDTSTEPRVAAATPLMTESPAASIPLATSARRISVAVLPFVNSSDDARYAHIGDGIAEDLITDLSKISRLSVVSRNTVAAYKGRTVAPQQIGHELGVQFVVDGNVRTAGDRVRITAQLVETGSGRQVWSDRYDRAFTDIFDLQDDVRENILKALSVKLSETEAQRLEERLAEPRLLAQTIGSITILRGGRTQAVYDLAQAHCRAQGRNAVLFNRAEGSDVYEFHCEGAN
ncbi:MAG TPA: adenylate/guanylate cyclase domain-containing protein [Alphaproteobacteria bacterium]|nr:adenylate/guanylate cyclase domain-containing protein [Alphaproteobacteria bacterium]